MREQEKYKNLRIVDNETWTKLTDKTEEIRKFANAWEFDELVANYDELVSMIASSPSSEYWKEKADKKEITDEDFRSKRLRLIYVINLDWDKNEMAIRRLAAKLKVQDKTVKKGFYLAYKNLIPILDEKTYRLQPLLNTLNFIGKAEESGREPIGKLPPEEFAVHNKNIRVYSQANVENRMLRRSVISILVMAGYTIDEGEVYVKHLLTFLERAGNERAIKESKETDGNLLEQELGNILMQNSETNRRSRFVMYISRVSAGLLLLGLTPAELERAKEKDFKKDKDGNYHFFIKGDEFSDRIIDLPKNMATNIEEYLEMVHEKDSDGSLIVKARAKDGVYIGASRQDINAKVKSAYGITSTQMATKGRDLYYMDTVIAKEKELGYKIDKKISDPEIVNIIVKTMRRYGFLDSDGMLTIADSNRIRVYWAKEFSFFFHK